MGSLFVKQAGALCWVDNQVVLVSKDDGNTWDVPAANVSEDGPAKHTVAEEQAWEQAGVLGYASENRVGEFLHSAGGKMYKVELFEIEAKKYRDTWPQSGVLKRGLFDPEEAVLKVDEFGLRDLLQKFARRRSVSET
jgi:hypothetical protein